MPTLIKTATTLDGPSNFPAIMPGTTQKIAVGVSHAESAAAGSPLVCLISTTACHVTVGAAAQATSDDMLLLANQVEYFHCETTDVVSVIRDSADGFLYVTSAA